MANAVIPPKTLRLGVDEALYVAPAGAINATGAMGTFAVPPQSSVWRGQLILQAVPIGGTVTTLTISFQISLDGGTTFATFIAAGDFVASPVQRFDISGMGGNGQMRLNVATIVLGTGTGVNVFAHIG